MQKKIYVLLFSGLLSFNARGQEWTILPVDAGTKPALAVDDAGVPQISYMLESFSGFVKHAVFNESLNAFEIETVSTGYFYGPLALALDENGNPHINYHDHDVEDQMHAFKTGDQWSLQRIENAGHDGWDNAIVIGSDNRIHTSTIDPSGFDGVGVEYAVFNGSTWSVEAVGSGPVMYANGTSIALDSQERPYIAYFNDTSGDLILARKIEGNWEIETVISEGDAGRFSSLEIDENDQLHLSFYEAISPSTGNVIYATKTGGAWNFEVVDQLTEVFIGFSGARNATSIELDDEGRPHITYSDEKFLKYAVRDSEWHIETVVDETTTDKLLGQLTSFAMDDAGRLHVAYFEVDTFSPLTGAVMYAQRDRLEPVSVDELPAPGTLEAVLYPNPARNFVTVAYEIANPSTVSISLYDLLGRQKNHLPIASRPAGSYRELLHGEDLAPGVYVVTLETEYERITRRITFLP